MVVLEGGRFLMSEVPLYPLTPAHHPLFLLVSHSPCLCPPLSKAPNLPDKVFFFFITPDTGPGRPLSLKLSDTNGCEP